MMMFLRMSFFPQMSILSLIFIDISLVLQVSKAINYLRLMTTYLLHCESDTTSKYLIQMFTHVFIFNIAV